ncbi:MAG: type II toxin-antitoxin system HicB family antitoxin [Cyanobacteria bacterium J06614_10]
MRYPVVLHKDSDSDYGVTIPDLPGCFSAGSSIDEALQEAIEAAECHIEGLLVDAEDIPSPIAIETHQTNPDYTEGIWAFIDVDLSKLSGKVRRVNITIPERILTKIDAFAQEQGESRSGLIATATMEYISGYTSRD